MAESTKTTAAAPVKDAAAARDALIEQWFVESIHDSPVSRHTEVYNHVRKAVDDLKQRLR